MDGITAIFNQGSTPFCQTEVPLPPIVPKPHTLGSTVCETGTMRAVIVPKPHTLAATVCGTGTMPDDVSYPDHTPQRSTTLGTA